jgi:GntR family transcriptional regulator
MATQYEPDWKRLLTVSRESALPLYHQVFEALRVTLGRLEPHLNLPTEEKLMEYSGVSRATIRKAISELTAMGLIYTVQGRGTFAADPRVATNLRRPVGFTESITEMGLRPTTRLLSVREEDAKGHIAECLNVAPGSPLTVVERLRNINDRPSMLEISRLRSAVVPDLARHDLTTSLYGILKDAYGLTPETGSETIMAIVAAQSVAEQLEIENGSPVLATIRRTFTANGAPLEYTLRYARADMCTFQVSLDSGSRLSARRPNEGLELHSGPVDTADGHKATSAI